MQSMVIRRGLTTGQTVLITSVVVVVILVVACFGAAFLAGLLLPAIGQARSAVTALQSQSQLMSFESAREAALSQGLEGDLTLDALVEAGYLIVEFTQSPFGPLEDGSADYWFAHERPAVDESPDPSIHIVAYDRAMYASHRTVTVTYLDGSVEILSIDDFEAMINSPPNDPDLLELPERGE